MNIKKTVNKLIKLVTLLILLVMVSCIPQKKLRYLQEVEGSVYDTTYINNNEQNYKLRANDQLYIKVNSTDPETFMIFNGADEGGANQRMDEARMYFNGYTITDSGYVKIPVAGKIYIEGLKIKEAQEKIETVLKQYLNDLTVNLKLAGFKFTVIGEIKSPGQYMPYVNSLNIFEAIAMCGDMTPYGNRKRVMIVRNENGKEHIHILNLLDKNIINSEHFYLVPNDIIYVESLNAKTWGTEKFPYGLFMSSFSMLLGILTLLKVL